MSVDQNFAKRTGECLKGVKANNGYACSTLDEYRSRKAFHKETLRKSSFEFLFRPTDSPLGIWSSADAEARSRPQSRA